ncbi:MULTISPECIES: DNA repair protein RecN [Janthinobacterium]|jgi:DNA repair protein RecN (Recombination protein N)|uniref:DNA repair protein RecN n=1 Tax=Janthinobacterium lividum TaxID=29581 RepID=A0AAJ4MSQ6_9BURK|nr:MULTISPECIES: DNA repair protein RecN [Janthinobacterium]KAB0327096.1 DNA repair protein RecN [Janthinobacterium lividum]MBR7633412.1 DNA repair protein RecN [Janthinobacterium lividum]MDO8035500.1 DNA repair protein RecN [Janthinobacterium sp. SUN128]MDQ4626695.1 DNA repair protein RecN [Janthinobacterium lividum]MDQ4674338.1 DNA repair protein RecN [Janthinobacterium lividum]
MLHTLSIRDFVIVDTIELEFSAGFSVLTGETGAGKSILIDALTLALGGRGDASVVREGAAKADITADFSVSEVAQAWLVAHEFANDDGGALLRRVIDNAGRSKAYINGIPATAAQLRELGDMLVDIHGQHAHQSLLKSEAQRALLDGQATAREAGAEQDARQVAALHKRWRALVRQREEFETNAANVLYERERLEWQVGELEKLAAKPGEWTDITNEHSRLSHAASLLEGAQEALSTISESEDHPIVSQLSALNQKLGKLVSVDAELQPIVDLIESSRIQLQESVYALNNYLDRVELDPERLHQLDARMEAMHSTARKFRVTPEELPEEHAKLSEKLQHLADASDIEGLLRQEAKIEAEYRSVAERLSDTRRAAALELGHAVTRAMQELSMTGGSFEIALHPCEPAAHGLEQVEFLVAGHAGTAPRSLAKVASGGELARIALAISVITSHATTTPTLIFDEVDSGIGGAVAEVVGRLLKRLGQGRQVLCVTHLPQVASQANQHFQVAKSTLDNGKTASRIDMLDAKARVEEVARMLGGLEITATTRKHARELLAI